MDPTFDRMFKVKTKDGELELDAYSNEGFAALSELWVRAGWQNKQSYEVAWMGVPIIQLPEDILMLQEMIWRVRPTTIVETGIAHGGALILYASILELLGKGRVIGVDVEIRKYNRLAIESHSMSKRITMIEGSSVDPVIVEQVTAYAQEEEGPIIVMLDSNHTYGHVSKELALYSDLVTPGSYIVVFDTVMPLVADTPNGSVEWSQDNPLRAVTDFLQSNPTFEMDHSYERLAASYFRCGVLRRTS